MCRDISYMRWGGRWTGAMWEGGGLEPCEREMDWGHVGGRWTGAVWEGDGLGPCGRKMEWGPMGGRWNGAMWEGDRLRSCGREVDWSHVRGRWTGAMWEGDGLGPCGRVMYLGHVGGRWTGAMWEGDGIGPCGREMDWGHVPWYKQLDVATMSVSLIPLVSVFCHYVFEFDFGNIWREKLLVDSHWAFLVASSVGPNMSDIIYIHAISHRIWPIWSFQMSQNFQTILHHFLLRNKHKL